MNDYFLVGKSGLLNIRELLGDKRVDRIYESFGKLFEMEYDFNLFAHVNVAKISEARLTRLSDESAAVMSRVIEAMGVETLSLLEWFEGGGRFFYVAADKGIRRIEEAASGIVVTPALEDELHEFCVAGDEQGGLMRICYVPLLTLGDQQIGQKGKDVLATHKNSKGFEMIGILHRKDADE